MSVCVHLSSKHLLFCVQGEILQIEIATDSNHIARVLYMEIQSRILSQETEYCVELAVHKPCSFQVKQQVYPDL